MYIHYCTDVSCTVSGSLVYGVRYSSPGQYINDNKARLPYSRTEEYGLKIDGLPASCALKHPSSYGRSTLRSILDNRENLRLYGKKVRLMLAAS